MKLEEKLYKQQQDLLNQRDVISNQQKKMAQRYRVCSDGSVGYDSQYFCLRPGGK